SPSLIATTAHNSSLSHTRRVSLRGVPGTKARRVTPRDSSVAPRCGRGRRGAGEYHEYGGCEDGRRDDGWQDARQWGRQESAHARLISLSWLFSIDADGYSRPLN